MTVLDDHIDDDLEMRLRAAGALLRRDAELRPLRAAPSAQPPVVRTIAFAAVVVAVLLAGLVAIGHRTDRLDPSSPDPALPWILPDLGAAGRPVSVTTPQESVADRYQESYTVYGTRSDPDAPVVVVTPTVEQAIGLFETDVQFTDQRIGDVDVVTATMRSGPRAWAQLGDRWYTAYGSGLDSDAVATALAQAEVGPDGTLVVPPGALPDGAELLGRGTLGDLAPAWSCSAPPGRATTILYATAGTGNVWLAEQSGTGVELPLLAAIDGRPESVDVGGRPGWQFDSCDAVVWVADDELLVLSSSGGFADPSAAVSAAASVRHASADEWAGYPGPPETSPAEAPANTELPAGTELVGESPSASEPAGQPVDTVPPTPGDGTDDQPIELEWTTVIPEPHVVQMRTTLPSGDLVSGRTQLVAGQYRIDGFAGSSPLREGTWGTWAESETTRLLGVTSGGAVLTRDAAAVSMVLVTQSGRQFVVPLIEVPDSGGTRTAVLLLPLGDLAARIDLLDGDDQVLESKQLREP